MLFFMVGDVPIDSKLFVVTSSNSRICQRSDVLIMVELHICIQKDECACIYLDSLILYYISIKISTGSTQHTISVLMRGDSVVCA